MSAATGGVHKQQVGGDHYLVMSLQPWEALQAWMTPQEFAAFLRGNVIKYLARKKNGLEDLRKARHVLDKLIEVTEAAEAAQEQAIDGGYWNGKEMVERQRMATP